MNTAKRVLQVLNEASGHRVSRLSTKQTGLTYCSTCHRYALGFNEDGRFVKRHVTREEAVAARNARKEFQHNPLAIDAEGHVIVAATGRRVIE